MKKVRIKYSKLSQLKNLTNREMDLFLYLARYQNLAGQVVGVHNRAVCRSTGMCKQSFYTSLYSLAEKGVISYAKNTEIDYDVQITDNDFSYPEAFREGYVNLHRAVFHQDIFKKLKANEKYMLFEFLKRTHENSSSYKVRTYRFYDIFTELLGVTGRVIRCYLHTLRHFFSVGIKNGIYYITYKHSVFHRKEKKGVEDTEFQYFVEVQCRRERIREWKEEEVANTSWLLKQYRPVVQLQELKQLLKEAVHKSVTGVEADCRTLNSRYIHTILKTLI
ncbi:hypothetical protein [uncultured Merdimonas sp.]|uniref:hypothetical protein n=1 Tax=uncultured Merdimonas sp. TaxID=2023269 RepID=UPI00320AC437